MTSVGWDLVGTPFSFILWKNSFGACSLGLLTASSLLFPKKTSKKHIQEMAFSPLSDSFKALFFFLEIIFQVQLLICECLTVLCFRKNSEVTFGSTLVLRESDYQSIEPTLEGQKDKLPPPPPLVTIIFNHIFSEAKLWAFFFFSKTSLFS